MLVCSSVGPSQSTYSLDVYFKKYTKPYLNLTYQKLEQLNVYIILIIHSTKKLKMPMNINTTEHFTGTVYTTCLRTQNYL